MKIICYYNKNLKLTEGKLASQIGHVTKELGRKQSSTPQDDIIIVLKLSKKKFDETLELIKSTRSKYYIQQDLGFSEVEKGTKTCFGYIDDE